MSKNPNFWHLITLNSRIKIFFFKIPAVSLSLFHWPLISCKLSEKSNEHFPSNLVTDRPRTEQQTNKSNYYEPHRVNPWSKIIIFKVLQKSSWISYNAKLYEIVKIIKKFQCWKYCPIWSTLTWKGQRNIFSLLAKT